MNEPKMYIGFTPPKEISPPSVFVSISGPKSLMIQSENDFRVKLRNLLDRLENLKYIKSTEIYFAPQLTMSQKEFLQRLEPIRAEVCREIESSFGSYDDSIVGLQNFFGNITNMIRYPDVSQLSVRKGFSAVVIAAGPSFEIEIENLKKASEHCLLVAVDATLPRLVKEGIEPDIVVSTERFSFSKVFLDSFDHKLKTLFLGQPTIPPDFYDVYRGPKACVGKFSGPFLWLPFDFAHFWTGSSSAHLAYSVACHLGAQSVALVGQDLAYHPDSFQSHSFLEVYPEWSEAKSKEELVQKESAFEVQGNTRDKVLTQPVWETFTHEFELLSNKWKTPTINTSILGRKIPSIPFQEFSSWLKDQSSKVEKIFPAFNPRIQELRFSYLRHSELALRSLTALKERIEHSRASDEIASLYSSLRAAPHFLELVFELVITDFAATESQIFRKPSNHIRIQNEFLQKSKSAIVPVIDLLMQSRKLVEQMD